MQESTTQLYSYLVQQRLTHIERNPELHKHSYIDLVSCCIINSIVISELFTAHLKYVQLGINGNIKCDVTSGPCNCGAWH